LEPERDVQIQYIGLRPGERLEEPLWTQDENPQPTEYPKILKLNCSDNNFPLDSLLEELYPICVSGPEKIYRNRNALLKLLTQAVPSLKDFYDATH